MYQPPTPSGQFNTSRGGPGPQANQKALLTTQLNFAGSNKQQIYASKRPAAMNSGYSSRNTTQPDVKTLAGLSNKKPQEVGGQRSNDYLRLKRVTNALAQQHQHQESSVKQK